MSATHFDTLQVSLNENLKFWGARTDQENRADILTIRWIGRRSDLFDDSNTTAWCRQLWVWHTAHSRLTPASCQYPWHSWPLHRHKCCCVVVISALSVSQSVIKLDEKVQSCRHIKIFLSLSILCLYTLVEWWPTFYYLFNFIQVWSLAEI